MVEIVLKPRLFMEVMMRFGGVNMFPFSNLKPAHLRSLKFGWIDDKHLA